MTNYWAIAIGINQYQDRNLQPLMYAQRDAQTLLSCWVEENRFAPDHCRLLTDISPAIQQGVIQPTQANIRDTIQHVCQQLQPGDFLWCFFSGYGAQFEGQDYLMPVDGDLNQVAATGIAVESLFELFSTAATENILFLLDINRSQGALVHQVVGNQVLQLASHYEIATILSCAPTQFSHETLSLRNGLFTAALLEGLRYESCVTLEHLMQYLSSRLPELSEHHWRPRQDPMGIIPFSMKYQLLVPGKAIAMAVGATALRGRERPEDYANPFPTLDPNPFPAFTEDGLPEGVQPADQTPYWSFPALSYDKLSNGAHVPFQDSATRNLQPSTLATESAQPNGSATPNPSATADEISDELFWRRLLLWGGLLAAVLLAGVLINNWSAIMGKPSTNPESGANSSGVSDPSASTASDPIYYNSVDDLSPGVPGQSPPANLAPTTTPIPPAGTPSPSDPGMSLLPTTPAPTTSPVPLSPEQTPAIAPSSQPSGQPSNQPSNQTNAAFGSVRTALTARNYGVALQLLDQVPANQRTGDYANLLQQAAQGSLLEARAAVSRIRAMANTNQASDFNIAIQIARRLRPGHPYYEDAQQDISNWSEVIFQLARGRASQPNQGSSEVAARNYNSAIAAAKLVPSDRGAIYTEAQESINRWSQYILSAAQSRLNEGRLDLALQIAQMVPANTTAYPAAQQAIAQWSQRLLDQAQAMATEGNLTAAIQTAQLVPQNTPSYPLAQGAIANWQAQQNDP